MKKLAFYMSLVVTGLLMAACNEDFKDWAAQKTYLPEDAITIPGYTASAASAAGIDLNTETGETVQLINLSGAALPEGYLLNGVRAYIIPADDETAEPVVLKAANAEGFFSVADLQEAVVKFYGPRPTPRTFKAHVYADAIKDGQSALIDAGEINIILTPIAPQISENYYLIGGTNDWGESAKNKTVKFSHSGKDVYEDPIFTVVFAASAGDTWFAIGDDEACEAIANDNDWSKLYGTTKGNGNTDPEGTLDRRLNLADDGSFCVPAGAKFIKVTLNMMDRTYKIETVNISDTYYLIGGPGEWNAESAMTMKFSHSDKSVFDDPVFTYVLASSGSEMWFAFGDKDAIDAVAEGTWNQLFGTTGASEDLKGSFDRRYNLDGDHSFHVDGQAKFYRFQINVMEMTYEITPLNFSEYFYEIGNESGWSTAHALFGGAGDGKYLGYYYLDGEFKFKPNADNWDDDLEYVSGDATSGTLTSGGGPNCPDPGAGFYQINLDAAAMTYNLVKVNSISIIGTVNGNWDTDTDLTYNKETGAWEITTTLAAGNMKFRMNHDWTISWGGANGDPAAFNNLTEYNGKDLAVEAGTYKIQLYISYEGNNKVVMTKQ